MTEPAATPTSAPPITPGAPPASPDGRASSPLHAPVSPSSLAVGERARLDPNHPQNVGLHTGAPVAPSRGGLSPDQFAMLGAAERERFVAVRRPGGWDGVEYFPKGQVPRDDAPASRPGDAPAAAPDGGPTIKLGDREYTRSELDAIEARAALEASRKLTLPASPDGYKAELPADFKPPAGVKFEFDASDPLVAGVFDLAHRRGLDQETVSDGLALVASLRVSEQSNLQAAYAAEVAKLGAAGTQRVDAVVQWLNAMGGPKAATLANMFKIAPVADTIEAVEHIMRQFSSQGAAPGNAAHAATPPTGPTEQQYAAMSFAERMDYARSAGAGATNGRGRR